ncbi:MAG: hypothetical protein ABMB14_11035 [Myxococcota bacterium]
MSDHLDRNETQGVLVAGRRGPADLTWGQLRRLTAIVDAQDAALPAGSGLRLVAVAGGDRSAATDDADDADLPWLSVVIGHRSLRATANDGAPGGPVSLATLRGVVERAAGIPASVWAAVAEALPPEARAGFLAEPIALWLSSTGPLCAGTLAYGVVGTEADAADACGVPFHRGATQGAADVSRGGDDDGFDGFDEGFDEIASQVSHDTGVLGWGVQVGYEMEQAARIDLSDAAHAARDAVLGPTVGERGYFVLARYD